MQSYIQISISELAEDRKDQLIALLANIGFDGFEETAQGLDAFIVDTAFDAALLNDILQGLAFTTTVIEKQNWNQLWESNFEPVQVEDFVGIRAGFHQPMTGVTHEIVITPKMSFGTGHHATTYLVMQAMKGLNFKDKKVLDFGAGTGILAILAEKLGAASVLAIDNDDWCIENALENVAINQSVGISVEKADSAQLNEQYEMILANINKHIILENLPYLQDALIDGGTILLSGLLVEDESDILLACHKLGWEHQFTHQRNGWITCCFIG